PYYYNQNTMARFPRDGARFCTKYIDAPINAQFPFGYGLSYSEFEYSNLKLSSDEYSGADDIKVSVDVKNISEIDGEETVQVYVHDKVASMIRPVKELKAFEKVFIKSGETKTVELTIPVSSLGFYNIDMKYVVEPGDFDIYVGCNADSGLKTELRVV
ncbi:MAG: fibronectin type III-like domain-contianing protein, partial [Ruminococcus sp.]|nr:fibronectin type III-like domain-contianing protein [Ruminococcus sp.]